MCKNTAKEMGEKGNYLGVVFYNILRDIFAFTPL